MTQRRALVTGGTGFVGAHLVRRLLAEGWHVHLLTRAASSTSSLGTDIHRVKITRPDNDDSSLSVATAVARAIDEAAPSTVFSLATLRDDATLPELAQMIDANTRLPALLAVALAKRGEGTLIHTSSYQVISGAAAGNLHSATRASSSTVVEWATVQGGLHTATLAPSSIYGPNDRRRKIVHALTQAAVTGSPIALVHPDRMLDLIHVNDVTAAFTKAAEQLNAGTIDSGDRFDVTSGTLTSLSDLVSHIEEITERTIDVKWNVRDRSASDCVEPPKAPRWIPGWIPDVALGRGLRSLNLDSA